MVGPPPPAGPHERGSRQRDPWQAHRVDVDPVATRAEVESGVAQRVAMVGPGECPDAVPSIDALTAHDPHTGQWPVTRAHPVRMVDRHPHGAGHRSGVMDRPTFGRVHSDPGRRSEVDASMTGPVGADRWLERSGDRRRDGQAVHDRFVLTQVEQRRAVRAPARMRCGQRRGGDEQRDREDDTQQRGCIE